MFDQLQLMIAINDDEFGQLIIAPMVKKTCLNSVC